jgi:hypothetical protein
MLQNWFYFRVVPGVVKNLLCIGEFVSQFYFLLCTPNDIALPYERRKKQLVQGTFASSAFNRMLASNKNKHLSEELLKNA